MTDQVAEESTTTLAPLPTVTATIPPTTTIGATTTMPPTTTLAEQPVGEWDGARFDFGRIVGDGLTDDGIYRTIELDRYSYRDPSGVLVDAAGFTSEPLPAWWREEPWENNNPDTRQFVLAPNVELLALSDADDEVACADPPPAELPAPQWLGVDPSYLDTGRARDSIAVITYAPTGAISRIRFTTGC